MKTRSLAAASLLASFAALAVAHAEEGGGGHYMPGSTASFIDALPGKPSLSVLDFFAFYGAKADGQKTLPYGGQVAFGMDVDAYANSVGVIWQSSLTLLDGTYAAGIIVPYVWMETKANVSSGLGTISRKDSANGFGDIYLLPFTLGWATKEGWKYDVRFGIYAPTGAYDVGALANVGKNYWTFEPSASVSYLGASLFEFSAFAGVDINTRNDDTDYTTGAQFHFDTTVAKHAVFAGGMLGIGANAFVYQQISDDHGSGAVLGDFRGFTAGVGPVLSYVRKIGESDVAFEVKWLPELSVDNRTKGDYVWVKVAAVF